MKRLERFILRCGERKEGASRHSCLADHPRQWLTRLAVAMPAYAGTVVIGFRPKAPVRVPALLEAGASVHQLHRGRSDARGVLDFVRFRGRSIAVPSLRYANVVRGVAAPRTHSTRGRLDEPRYPKRGYGQRRNAVSH